MGESGSSIDANKILLTLLGPLLAAAIGASTVIYRHEQQLLRREQATSRLATQVYRQQVKNLEIWESYLRAQMQLLMMATDDNGRLPKYERALLNYYTQTKESIVITKENYVEEHKHENKGD
jgi:hypothetical protein